jgi:hypothetical protein
MAFTNDDTVECVSVQGTAALVAEPAAERVGRSCSGQVRRRGRPSWATSCVRTPSTKSPHRSPSR